MSYSEQSADEAEPGSGIALAAVPAHWHRDATPRRPGRRSAAIDNSEVVVDELIVNEVASWVSYWPCWASPRVLVVAELTYVPDDVQKTPLVRRLLTDGTRLALSINRSRVVAVPRDLLQVPIGAASCVVLNGRDGPGVKLR